MKAKINLFAAVMLLCPHCWVYGESSKTPSKQSVYPDSVSASVVVPEREAEQRADKRYEEMLNRMRAAVEEIAQLYGDPVFLQVFTNDAGRASELKQRLKATSTGEDIRRELTELEKRRDDLLNDIALKQREAAKLAAKLVRQRIALDTLAVAVEQAQKAVEETAK